ncbi:MAG: sugar-binding domain-containing protein [Thermoguttaceae bacterium]
MSLKNARLIIPVPVWTTIFAVVTLLAFVSVLSAQTDFSAQANFSEQAVFSGQEELRGSRPLLTRFGEQLLREPLTPGSVHAEYPRPTMMRPDWLNLNGYWEIFPGSHPQHLESLAFSETLLEMPVSLLWEQTTSSDSRTPSSVPAPLPDVTLLKTVDSADSTDSAKQDAVLDEEVSGLEQDLLGDQPGDWSENDSESESGQDAEPNPGESAPLPNLLELIPPPLPSSEDLETEQEIPPRFDSRSPLTSSISPVFRGQSSLPPLFSNRNQTEQKNTGKNGTKEGESQESVLEDGSSGESVSQEGVSPRSGSLKRGSEEGASGTNGSPTSDSKAGLSQGKGSLRNGTATESGLLQEKQGTTERKVLVPFPIESPLSGVGQYRDRFTYQRKLVVPGNWPKDGRILLHFGAVDWECAVFIDNHFVGVHRGGYAPFSFDITPFIRGERNRQDEANQWRRERESAERRSVMSQLDDNHAHLDVNLNNSQNKNLNDNLNNGLNNSLNENRADLADEKGGEGKTHILTVSVYDPTEGIVNGFQTQISDRPKSVVSSDRTPLADSGSESSASGKLNRPEYGARHDSVSGIWQTVWLEPVPSTYIREYRAVPNIETSSVAIQVGVENAGPDDMLEMEAFSRGGGGERGGNENRLVGKVFGGIRGTSLLSIPRDDLVLWSPEQPFLYTLKIRLVRDNKTIDSVEGYFGMRKIDLAKDSQSRVRIRLNNQFYFQLGVLDPGYWSDGSYTAPSDEAIQADLQRIKSLGFNLVRKPAKVESERWYFWCDRLGLLVWQDIPSGNNETVKQQEQFERELFQLLLARTNHPSIVMWTLFDEGRGQHKTEEYAKKIRSFDPNRLVNAGTGRENSNVGQIVDSHQFPAQQSLKNDPFRANVFGDFGRIALLIPEHSLSTQPFGEILAESSSDLLNRYRLLCNPLTPLLLQGLSGVVYHQWTDLATDTTGLMTIDRAILKVPEESVRSVNTLLRESVKDNRKKNRPVNPVQ